MSRSRSGWRSHPIMVELRRLGLLIILGHAILFSGIILRHESLILAAVVLMTGAIVFAAGRVGMRRLRRAPLAPGARPEDA